MEKLKVLQRNLTFSEALQALKEDKLIKLPEYKGYWFLKGGRVTVKTYDGQETTDPWLKETVLREDWQIVDVDREWYKDQQAEMARAIMDFDSMKYTSVGSPVDLEPIKEGVPVMENSNAFIQWLYSQNIEHRPAGSQTLILGNRDMFEIGCAWERYKSQYDNLAQQKPVKTRIESTPLGDIEVPE